MIADHPNAPSGVGTQTKYVIESLLSTGRYKITCFGGAIKHPDYRPQIVEPYGEDCIVYPVDGYGTQEQLRSMLWTEKPDILWFMTDPRFYEWLWDIENEIRSLVPMVYYHVWDNYPAPQYNKKWYQSNDVIACISKLTHNVVGEVAPDVERHYVPHAVNSNVFYKKTPEELKEFKDSSFGKDYDKVTFFWNNRNARRKMSGSVLWWFNEFAEEVGPENVRLIMHTDPLDKNGQNLLSIIHDLGADDGRVQVSRSKISPEALAAIYNAVDCTINISDAEGFGLATLESLSCGTPIIANMTGGLQEQVTDGENVFGVAIEPSSKAIIGSQQVPYIYEDRINREDFINALRKMYNMSKEEREKLGELGMEHVQKNYNFEKFRNSWIDLMDHIHNKYGSWENRANRDTRWSLTEIS